MRIVKKALVVFVVISQFNFARARVNAPSKTPVNSVEAKAISTGDAGGLDYRTLRAGVESSADTKALDKAYRAILNDKPGSSPTVNEVLEKYKQIAAGELPVIIGVCVVGGALGITMSIQMVKDQIKAAYDKGFIDGKMAGVEAERDRCQKMNQSNLEPALKKAKEKIRAAELKTGSDASSEVNP
jgi:hypothetical protein